MGLGSWLRSKFKGSAYEAGSGTSEDLRGWWPNLMSADAAWLPEREQIVGRTQDMIRNNGIASGAVQLHLDNVVGSGLILSAKPDVRALGLTEDEGEELEFNLEAGWRDYAYDIGKYCDASRKANFAGMLSQAYRSYLTQYEILATGEWLPGRSPFAYSTALQLIDPNRLSTPHGMVDNQTMRGGVEYNGLGEPIAYHISSEHTISPFISDQILRWQRIPKETGWGRPRVIHIYDIDQPGQSRGKGGIVAVLSKLKVLEKFERAALQAAILNAIYAAVIESPMPWDQVGMALGGVQQSTDDDVLANYMKKSGAYHRGARIRFNGVMIPHLYPGEKFELKNPQHPTTAFNSFTEAVLRYVAAGFNLTYEQLSRDYSKTNYSSARAAMLEAWRFFHGRQMLIANQFASLVYTMWMEEAFDRGDIKVPARAPSFYEARTAYTRCLWIGPGRGHIDPMKGAQSDQVYFKMGATTLEEICASQGKDWREVVAQRAQEKKYVDAMLGDGAYDSMVLGTPTPEAAPEQPERREEDEEGNRMPEPEEQVA